MFREHLNISVDEKFFENKTMLCLRIALIYNLFLSSASRQVAIKMKRLAEVIEQ
jgi:hypothetical protein